MNTTVIMSNDCFIISIFVIVTASIDARTPQFLPVLKSSREN
jgi:hypothetical protein